MRNSERNPLSRISRSSKSVSLLTIKKRDASASRFLMVGAARFELATSWSRTRRATELRYTPIKFSSASAKTNLTAFLRPMQGLVFRGIGSRSRLHRGLLGLRENGLICLRFANAGTRFCTLALAVCAPLCTASAVQNEPHCLPSANAGTRFSRYRLSKSARPPPSRPPRKTLGPENDPPDRFLDGPSSPFKKGQILSAL